MSNGYAADEPRHVEMAQIDEDVREMAIQTARLDFLGLGFSRYGEKDYFRRNCVMTRKLLDAYRLPRFDRALRVLRHYGLLVEHGDGVVSVKEQA